MSTFTNTFSKSLFQQGSNSSPFPVPSLQSFASDLTVIESGGNYYFKALKGENLLITGYDFPTGWTKGFPYKSVATIDIFGQTGVPVVSLFQNFDYENKYFCKHDAQVVDVNGVEIYEARISGIVAYSEVLTGADLDKANVYFNPPTEDLTAKWVTSLGNDANAGTKALPKLTIQNVVSAFNTGQKIYFKTQNPFTLSTGYFNADLNNNLYFIGFCVIKPTDGTYLFRTQNANRNNISGLVAIREIADNCVLDISSGGNLVFQRNYIKMNLGQYVGSTGKDFFNNIFCGIFTNAVGCLRLTSPTVPVTVSGNLFAGEVQGSDIQYTAGSQNLSIINNKHVGKPRSDGGSNIDITKTITGNVLIKGNYFRNGNGNAANRMNLACVGNLATTDYLLEIAYNRFYIDFVDYKTMELKDHQINTPNIHDNYIEYTIGDRIVCISFHAGNALVERNIIYCPVIIGNTANQGEDDITGEAIANEILSASISQTIQNNKIRSNRQGNGHIHFGYGVSTNSDNKVVAVVKNNHISGFGYFNVSMTGTAYGIDIGNQINADVRYNFLTGIYRGIQIVGDYIYTEKGVQYNIFKNTVIGVSITGMNNVAVANNTIHTTYNDAIGLENKTGSEGTVFKNNIVAMLGTGSNYGAKVINGTTNYIDYNLYYSPNGTLKFSDGSDKTFAQWQALGYDTHSIVLTTEQYNGLFNDAINNDFSLKTGSVAIGSGVALDAAYDDGLDTSTNWGTDSQTPVVVTKQQGANWDIGAYIH